MSNRPPVRLITSEAGLLDCVHISDRLNNRVEMRFSAEILHTRLRKALLLSLWLGALVVACSDENADGSEANTIQLGIATAPGLKEASGRYVAPLADAMNRVDPEQDGWESEVFSENASEKLKKWAKTLTHPPKTSSDPKKNLFAAPVTFGLKPKDLGLVFENASFVVKRAHDFQTLGQGHPNELIESFMKSLFDGLPKHVELKPFKVSFGKASVFTRVYFHANGVQSGARKQVNAEWKLEWDRNTQDPWLRSIEAISHEEILAIAKGEAPLYDDCTEAVLGQNASYRDQLLHGTDHWRTRLSRDMGLDVIAHHGMALGDLNGDDLEDIYLCQQGGLPNRLFLRNADGTLKDVTQDSQTGWLDYSTSALLVDFDNDGYRDLVVCLADQIVFMSNDGAARFTVRNQMSTAAQTFSMTAADYDLDGDLDLFVCGYNPSHDFEQASVMGEPVPYHDAENGGHNLLFRNEGNWRFSDLTNATGLNVQNNRFSFAATWMDFDRDGDPDLYVANDYGRNNFYRNNGGMFTEISAVWRVEDMSAGMSATWADVNRDGNLDLYVSNMFSAAGNRIAFHKQFKPGIDPSTLQGFRRHARGNTLYLGSHKAGPFQDASEDMGVFMGRWAWGSRFVDFDQDGWEDLVVANGFITTEDTGDL